MAGCGPLQPSLNQADNTIMIHVPRSIIFLISSFLMASSALADTSTEVRSNEAAQGLPDTESPISISPEILLALPVVGKSKKITFVGERKLRSSNNAIVSTMQFKLKIKPLEAGLVQSSYEYTGQLNVEELMFQNLYSLGGTLASPDGKSGNMSIAINKIFAMDAVPMTVGKKFSGSTAIVGNPGNKALLQYEERCETKRLFDAEELHSKLTGKAMEFTCLSSVRSPMMGAGDMLVQPRKLAMLSDYGVAVELESVLGGAKSETRILDVLFE